VVPRFGLSCSERLLSGAGRLARSRRAYVLGHVSETPDEVAALRRLRGVGYVELYERAGLLGPRTLLAHGIHLTPGECERLAAKRTWVVHCPTSNEALGSGRMPLERIRSHGVRYCLGTDVGAGRALCMFDVMSRFLAVHRGRARTTPEEALWRATHAGADALGYSSSRGALAAGRQADFLHVPGGARGARSAGGAIRALLERYEAGGRHVAPGLLWRDGRPAGAAARRGRGSPR
jgi:guanine deaminase